MNSTAAVALAPLTLVLAGCSQLATQGRNVDGVRLHQRGNYQAAASRFMEAIANRPDLPDGYYNLAATLHQSGRVHNRPSDLQRAEDLYNQCLERDPNHTDCYRGLAVLLTETGRTDAAFRLLQGWTTASPQLADPRVELARLLQETGSAEQAKTQLVEALAIDPYHSRALAALARMRDEAGEYAQALEDYRRSLAANAQQPAVKQRIAALQAALGPTATQAISTSTTRIVQQPSNQVRY